MPIRGLREDLAWLAGFYDGEGSTTCSRKGQPRFDIAQNHIEVLEKAKSILGIGEIYWIIDKKGPRDGCYHYSIGSYAGVQYAIAMIWDWLGDIKREQAKNVLVRVRDSKIGWQKCQLLGHRIGTDDGNTNHHKCLTCKVQQNKLRILNRANT